jgi:hypothetical protein
MFYGHSNTAHTGVEHWWLIDLKAFRPGLIRHVGIGPSLLMGDHRAQFSLGRLERVATYPIQDSQRA